MMQNIYIYGKIMVAKRVAPAGAATPPGPDTKRRFVPMSTLPYVLRRVHAGGREGPVADYPVFEAGWRAVMQRGVHPSIGVARCLDLYA
jgi:hypothetical protein